MYMTSLPGPKITAFHTIMLSAQGAPEIPPGGSLLRRLKSRMSLLRLAVDMIQEERRALLFCSEVRQTRGEE